MENTPPYASLEAPATVETGRRRGRAVLAAQCRVRAVGAAAFAMVLAAAILIAPGTSAAHPRSGGEDLETLRKELEKSVRLNDIPGAGSAIRKIGALQSRKAMEVLLAASAALPEEGIYNGILEVLVLVTEPGALDFLSQVLRRDKDLGKKFDRWRYRVTVAKVFGTREDEETFFPLLQALHDQAFPVRRQALHSLSSRGDRRAFPAILTLLEEEQEEPGVLWQDVQKCLRRLSGMDLVEVVDWKNWWDAHGKDAPPEPGKEAGDDPAATRDSTALFFGVQIISKRIVFIIDVSGSMQLWDPGGGEQPKGTGGKGEIFPRSRQRIFRAKRELAGAIKDLRPQVKFNIITFSHKLNTLLSGKLITATRGNKAKAMQFVEGLRADGGTATDDALKEGFVLEEANTIILLSDGVPDKPGGDNPSVRQILEMVRKLNRFRKVKIYTFGFDGEGKKPPGMQASRRMTPGLLADFREMMKKIAEEHEGTYTSIR